MTRRSGSLEMSLAPWHCPCHQPPQHRHQPGLRQQLKSPRHPRVLPQSLLPRRRQLRPALVSTSRRSQQHQRPLLRKCESIRLPRLPRRPRPHLRRSPRRQRPRPLCGLPFPRQRPRHRSRLLRQLPRLHRNPLLLPHQWSPRHLLRNRWLLPRLFQRRPPHRLARRKCV